MKRLDNADMQQAALPDVATDCSSLLAELARTRALCKELDEIIEYTPEGIYITDGRGIAVRVNAAYERISGRKREDILGRGYAELVQAGSLIGPSNSLLAREQRTSVTVIHELPLTNRQVLDTCTPVFDEDGAVIMTVSLTRDVTELNELRATLELERESRKLYEHQLEVVKAQLSEVGELVAHDKAMLNTWALASRVARVDSTVLLTGETGVGKEVVARYIHKNGARSAGLFVEVNCGAISEYIAESELFGYEKGAFTGALQTGKPGLFEVANGGTLFLDEVGELPLELQVKLLRALQTNTVMRVGGTTNVAVDVRIIAATNKDLLQMVHDRLFREDLYYRLSVVPIHIPPLRDRQDDIIPLINHFLAQINARYGMNKSLSKKAYQTLLHYHWPGNVRELKNVIEQIAVIEEAEWIQADALPLHMQRQDSTSLEAGLSFREHVERFEYHLIEQASDSNSNVRIAAAALNIPVATFLRKRKKYREKYGEED